VISTWMSFEENTRDLGSFGEETDEITDLHQDSPISIVLRVWRWHRRHKATESQRSRLNVNLEPSTWRRRQKHQATPSRDENLIHTLRDYFKPTHEGMNTIKLPVGNNVVPLRPNTIWQFTTNRGPRSFNEAANSWKEKLNFYWAHAQTFTNPQNGSFFTYSSNYQTNLEKALIDFDAHQEKRLSSLRTQLEQQQDDMISKINLLWKAITKNLDDAPLCDTADKTDEEVENEKEVKEETKGKAEEEKEDNLKHFDTFLTMKELRYHEWLLKNPRPPLEPRRKPSNPKKNYNFIGRVKGLRVFVRNFTYKCDFMVLEDTTSIIDHYLGSVVFGKPFVEATGLVYNKEEGMVVFERDKERIIFKIQKIDMFKHVDFTDRGTDSLPHFIIESDDDNYEKTHYSNRLNLRPEYKYDDTWMTFRGITRDLGSFGEETDEITELHQDSPRSIVLRAWRRRCRHKAMLS
nr:protein kinase-like domain, concanavalin A-like lectin/glucanase domain protein [Tanacetum cinerariifolium]